MSKAWEEVKGAASSVADSVGNMAEGAVAAVGGVGEAAIAGVSGGSVRDGLAKATDGVAKAGSGYLDAVTGGQGAKLDAVSGGLYSATKNTYSTGSDLLRGESVRDNLQDAGRLGLVAATGGYAGVGAGLAVNTALIGKDGKSDISVRSLARAGATQTGGVVSNILKSIGFEGNSNSNSGGSSGNTQGGYFSDITSDIYQGEGKSIIIPVIVVFVVVTVVIIIKRKK